MQDLLNKVTNLNFSELNLPLDLKFPATTSQIRYKLKLDLDLYLFRFENLADKSFEGNESSSRKEHISTQQKAF